MQIFTAKSLYMFRVSQHPSSGVLKTVTGASGTGHDTGTAAETGTDDIANCMCKFCLTLLIPFVLSDEAVSHTVAQSVLVASLGS